MDTLTWQIRRARRRLSIDFFLRRLSVCWCAALVVAVAAIGIAKLRGWDVEATWWAGGWLGGATAAGWLVALGWTLLRRQSPIQTAIEIDSRCGLRERVSSSLALSEEQRQTAAGRALIADATRRIEQLDVAQAFTVRPDRWTLLPLAPAAAALVLLTGNWSGQSLATAKTSSEQTRQIQVSAKQLEKKLLERRQAIRAEGLEDGDELVKKIEQGVKDLAGKNDLDRKQTLVKLHDLVKDLEQRRDHLAGDEKLKQQFDQLTNLERGPADKFAQALKQGDLKQAIAKIDELKNRLAQGDLPAEEKQQLAEQLNQMRQALDKAAANREHARQELEKQIEQARQAGRRAEAERLQPQLDKLASECAKCDRMSDLAKQLGGAAASLEKGDAPGAQSALAKLSSDLAEMQQASEELELLDQTLDDLAEAKNAMNCPQCQGAGCAQCRGGGKGQRPGNAIGQRPGKGQQLGNGKGQQPGNGVGQGRGQGDPSERETPTGFYDSQVRQHVGKGTAVVSGEADGPNRKGIVQEEIKSAFETARREAADPLTGQRLPREYREHAKTYFDSVRDGQK